MMTSFYQKTVNQVLLYIQVFTISSLQDNFLIILIIHTVRYLKQNKTFEFLNLTAVI